MNENPFVVYDDTGDPHTLPTRWAICGTCRGDGYQALHGMEIDPFDWEPEELDEYLHGTAYRTVCPECDGSGKVREPDTDRCPPWMQAEWDAQQLEAAESRAIEAQERRMGA